MINKMFVALAILASGAALATAAPTITAGNHLLLPNTPGQIVPLLASGEGAADLLAGADLFLVIGGGTAGPVATGFDIVGPGTIFSGNNNGQQDFGAPYIPPGRELAAFVTTLSGTVAPNGVLAYLTLDTTGITSGNFSLSLTSDVIGPSILYAAGGAPTILLDGTLSVVPEPSTVVLALFGAVSVTAMAIRRRGTR